MANELEGKKAIIAAAAIRYLFRIRNMKHEARAYCREWIKVLRAEMGVMA
jgi:hypothetical protein